MVNRLFFSNYFMFMKKLRIKKSSEFVIFLQNSNNTFFCKNLISLRGLMEFMDILQLCCFC